MRGSLCFFSQLGDAFQAGAVLLVRLRFGFRLLNGGSFACKRLSDASDESIRHEENVSHGKL